MEWDGFGPCYHPFVIGSTDTSVTPPNPTQVILELVLIPVGIWPPPPFLLLTGRFENHSVVSILFAFLRFARGQSSKVVLGAHSLSKNEASKQTFEIKRFIRFPRFTSDPKSNDIMLVEVCSIAFLQFLQHSYTAQFSC